MVLSAFALNPATQVSLISGVRVSNLDCINMTLFMIPRLAIYF